MNILHHPAFTVPVQFLSYQNVSSRTTILSTSQCPLMSNEKTGEQGRYTAIQTEVANMGYTLKNSSVGPLLQLTLFDAKGNYNLASLSGAILPNRRLHVESYRAFVPTASTTLFKLTPAMMVFIAALALAADRGARHVYGLAIEDNADQHRRLVAYLIKFGGQRVHRVDDSLRSLPARVLYGGFGTVVRGDIASMLVRGMRMINRQKSSTPER